MLRPPSIELVGGSKSEQLQKQKSLALKAMLDTLMQPKEQTKAMYSSAVISYTSLGERAFFWLPFWRIPKEAKEHADDQLRSSSIKDVVANETDSEVQKFNLILILIYTRKSYAKLLRTILIIVHSICFYKTKPEASGKSLWEHHSKVYSLMMYLEPSIRPDDSRLWCNPTAPVILNSGDFVVPVWNATYLQLYPSFSLFVSLIYILQSDPESREVVGMKRMKIDWVPYVPLGKRSALVERLRTQICVLTCV
ncbi:hypothetical protein Tco_1555674 [Tanacetum coccineum]